jgi:hypothetical protein
MPICKHGPYNTFCKYCDADMYDVLKVQLGDNHYKWLERNFEPWLKTIPELQANKQYEGCKGMITAHGDKCSSYKHLWAADGIKFEHGVALYLLSYLPPFSASVRDGSKTTKFVNPWEWVIKMYETRFEDSFKDFI